MTSSVYLTGIRLFRWSLPASALLLPPTSPVQCALSLRGTRCCFFLRTRALTPAQINLVPAVPTRGSSGARGRAASQEHQGPLTEGRGQAHTGTQRQEQSQAPSLGAVLAGSVKRLGDPSPAPKAQTKTGQGATHILHPTAGREQPW